jgi:drug/metabolite transporter (DMT)-like permease
LPLALLARIAAHRAMPPPRPLDRYAVMLMAMLCGSWGFNQVAAKLALADFGPITQAALRSALGSLVVGAYAWRCKPGIWRSDGTLGAGLSVGLLFALEFVLLFVAVKLTTAASVVVFLYTAPFFVALGARLLLPGERLRRRQWIGMALAFSGVAAGLYRPSEGSSLVGDLLAIAGAAAWGATTIVIKTTSLRSADAAKTLLYQIVTSAFACGVVAWAAGERLPAHVSPIAALSLAYQSIWVVGVTYLTWFWLLRVYRAAELSAFTFVTPVLGVLAGWLVLGEHVTLPFLAALALVAAGIVTVTWPARG